jgi:elongation factor Ts
MTKISIEKVKDLRIKTGSSIANCKEALEKTGDDTKKALDYFRKKGAKIASEKKNKITDQGMIEAYIHSNKRIGVLIKLTCQTDFVAKNEEFKNLAHNLAMHIAAMNPKDVQELLKQAFIKEEKITIKELVDEKITKLGENVQIKKFERYQIG